MKNIIIISAYYCPWSGIFIGYRLERDNYVCPAEKVVTTAGKKWW